MTDWPAGFSFVVPLTMCNKMWWKRKLFGLYSSKGQWRRRWWGVSTWTRKRTKAWPFTSATLSASPRSRPPAHRWTSSVCSTLSTRSSTGCWRSMTCIRWRRSETRTWWVKFLPSRVIDWLIDNVCCVQQIWVIHASVACGFRFRQVYRWETATNTLRKFRSCPWPSCRVLCSWRCPIDQYNSWRCELASIQVRKRVLLLSRTSCYVQSMKCTQDW